MKKKILSLNMLLLLLAGTAVVEGNESPPPVDQLLGIPDVILDNTSSEKCRFCHDNRPEEPGELADRHHLLLGKPYRKYNDAPYPGSSVSGNYECVSCHGLVVAALPEDTLFSFTGICWACHRQAQGAATIHHRAKATKPLNCRKCHGHIDSPDDGHYIPVSLPTYEIPKPGVGAGPFGQGGCTFCHNKGLDTASNLLVSRNFNNHHYTGIVTGPYEQTYAPCWLCHENTSAPAIRKCETCHGINSLHNIQIDVNKDGKIIPGQEQVSGHGHVGTDRDCNGCHGFGEWNSSTVVSRAIVPQLDTISPGRLVKGDGRTVVTLTGKAMINLLQRQDGGYDEIRSLVKMTAIDSSKEIIIVPGKITQSEIVFSPPSYLEVGTYRIQVVKEGQISNAQGIVVLPHMRIDRALCQPEIESSSSLVVTGGGFGDTLGGAWGRVNSGLGLTTDLGVCSVLAWEDGMIRAHCPSSCPRTVTVAGLYMSGSADVENGPELSQLDGICTKCHTDRQQLLACGNLNWALHRRFNLIPENLAILAETTYLGSSCHPVPPAVKDTSRKPR